MEQTFLAAGLRKRFGRTVAPGAPDAGETLVSFGIATAVRDAAIAAGIVLGLLYLFPILGLAISSPGWHRHLRHVSPVIAGLKFQASTGLSSLPVSPWGGLGLLAAGAAAALLVGGLLLRFRDA